MRNDSLHRKLKSAREKERKVNTVENLTTINDLIYTSFLLLPL